MAITFVGSHVGTHASTSAQTVNFSSLRDESGATPTLQEGDYVLVAVENSTNNVDRTQGQLTPSGYDPLHTDRYENDSNDSNFLVSGKFMGATPDTSVAIPASNATTAGVAYAIYVFRGVSPTDPMDATPAVTGAINTGVANAPGITPTTPGAWIVVFGGAAVAAGAVFTNPSGMSTTTNHFRTATITTTTTDANIGGAIYTGWTSGPYDPAAFGGSTTTNTGSWSAVTLALRPYIVSTGSLEATESGSDTADITGTVQEPGVSGTLAAAEAGDDAASLSGAVSWPTITGSLAASETGSDTAALSGGPVVSGALAAAETGSDAFAGSGGPVVSGALSVGEAEQDAASASASVEVSGALAASEVGADSFSAEASVIPAGVGGVLAAFEAGDDTLSASGAVQSESTPAGQVIGSRRRKFRPSIIFDWFKDEKVEEDYDGSAAIVPAVSVGGVSLFAVGEINFDGFARIAPAIASPSVSIEAKSGWNDPTDEEITALLLAVF